MDPIYEAQTRFAQAVYLQMRKKRYGIKSCDSSLTDPEKIWDLINLREDQSERVDQNLLETPGCSLTTIDETLCSL